jgi:hypothetical protein
MLRDLVAYFHSVGVANQEQLREWAKKTTFADFEGRVRGLGRAVYQWLVMRQGIDTIKPDVHVHRFVASVLGRQLRDADLVEVVTKAAHRLSRPAMRLDWAIWEAGRSAPRTRTSPPRPITLVQSELESSRSVPTSHKGAAVRRFLDDDAGYLSWLSAHPSGFVLNSDRRPNARYLVVHRAGCASINPVRAKVQKRRTWTVAYSKTCAEDLGDLTQWAGAEAGEVAWCGLCRPKLATEINSHNSYN